MNNLAQKIQEPTSWGYISGWIKAQEKSLLNRNQLQSLVTAKTNNDLLKIFGEGYYKIIFNTEKDLLNCDELLQQEIINKLDWVRKYSPQGLVADYFKVKLDMQDLKAQLKEILNKASSEGEIIDQQTEQKTG